MKYRTLNNGVEMPLMGFGTYKLPVENFDEIINSALDAGYRMFDTAQMYGNEEYLGNALAKQTKVKRNELFITTKIGPYSFGYEKTKQAIDGSLKRLQTDYIDLLLIHGPYGDVFGAGKAFEEYLQAGKIKAIGVSNFNEEQLENLIIGTKIRPVINQIELHPFYQREDDVKFDNSKDVAVESGASFARGKDDAFTNPVLAKIGKKYNKSNAQVILRGLIQRDITVIPKSQTPERIKANMNIGDFELTDDEMNEIKKLDKNKTLFDDPNDPSTVLKISSNVPKYYE